MSTRKTDIYPENAVEQTILTSDDYQMPEIVSISSSNYTKNWKPLSLHRHKGCMEICYCRRGSLKFECDGRMFTLLPDNIFLSQPDNLHRLTTNHKGVICYWLVFRYPKRGERILGLPLRESLALHRSLRSIKSHLFAVNSELQALFKSIFRTVTTETGPLRSLKLRTSFAHILLLVAESSRNAPGLQGLNRITHIARIIARRPGHRFTTAELAAHAHLSESRFTALFRQVIGLPPYAYLLDCRLNEAKRRLVRTSDTIARIANDLGFVSAQHLAGLFRKTLRMTPSAFRDEGRKSGGRIK